MVTQDPRPAQPFPYRILFVDDDDSLAELYLELLRAAGYDVHLAHNGFEALASLRQSLPDLVISDLCMPGMSGLELLGVIRRRFPTLPLIALSGGDGLAQAEQIADAALRRGDDGDEQVAGVVARWVRPGAARRVPAQLPWVPRQPATERRLVCSECLRAFQIPEAALSLSRGPKGAGGVHSCLCAHCAAVQSFVTDAGSLAEPADGGERAGADGQP